VPSFLSKQVQKQVPIFKIAADQGTHPPVGLDRPVCVVGRHDYANLPLPAKAVSKIHALIVREQRRVYVRDLASTNGVEVNGKAIRETALSDADTVRIGAFTLRCYSGFGENGTRPSDNGAAAGDGADAPQAELRSAAGNVSFTPGRHTLVIGQRDGCDVRLKHASILPVHAVVFELDGRHYIQTFAPEYATRVNGKPVHREALQPGDELRVGDVKLTYALVDLSADSVAQPASAAASSSGSMSGTGDSLIQPVLDSSITPAIDPAHHGELEADESHASAEFDVVDGEHAEESLIQPTMDSSIAPAAPAAASAAAPGAAAGAAAALTPATPTPDETEDFGLDIEPLDSVSVEPLDADEPLAEASLDVEPLDVAEPDAAPAASEPTSARPAAPPTDSAEKPAQPAIAEPVIEPLVARAAEHGLAAAIEPVAHDSPAAPAQPAAPAKPPARDDMSLSIDGDAPFDGNSSFDLEPLRASDDLEPIDINAEPQHPPAAAAAAAAGPGGGGDEGRGAADLADAIRATWDAPKKRDISKLSATYDEDNALDLVDPGKSRDDDGGLSVTIDEDDAMMPLTDADDDADLLGVDHTDLVEAGQDAHAAVDEAPAAEQAKATPLAEAPMPAPALTSPSASASASALPEAAAVVAGAVATLSSQAAKLTELAHAAGLGDETRAAAAVDATPVVTAQDITRLIEDVAAKVEALRAAWTVYQRQRADPAAAAAATPPANTPPDAQQDEPFEFNLADAPPASS
jgi:pSer/pThr/pTyr-binding forkhead associated (FHA) protein